MSQNTYLKSKYGITLEEKRAIMRFQKNRCAICGREFTPDVRTEVDHEHFKLALFRYTQNGIKGWYGNAIWKNGMFSSDSPWAKTKKEATKLAKKYFVRMSVRGVLCGGRHAGCNRRLGRVDSLEWLHNALHYIRTQPARLVLYGPEAQNENPAEKLKIIEMVQNMGAPDPSIYLVRDPAPGSATPATRVEKETN